MILMLGVTSAGQARSMVAEAAEACIVHQER